MDPSTDQDRIYQIRLKGLFDHTVLEWFGNIAVILQRDEEVLLIGQVMDQPALRGILNQLWNLNYTILSVKRVENPNDLKPYWETEKEN